MYRLVSAVIVSIAITAMAAPSAQSQDSLLNELYGAGVHAYFAQNYMDAHKHLSSAIDNGSTDPRCYYFRGMAYVQLGRPDEAQADFQQGATLELTSDSLAKQIGGALERVQGPWRLKLEQTRRGARLAAQVESAKSQKARYDSQRDIDISGIDTSEPTVEDVVPLTDEGTPPGDEETPLAPVEDPPKGTDDETDPFGTATDGGTEAPDNDNPFGTDTTPPVVDPTPPVVDPTPPTVDDGDASDSRDPFGDDEAAPTKPADTPEKPADTDDPFVDDPEKPDAPEGDTSADDLFGGAAEAPEAPEAPEEDEINDLFK